MQTFTLPPAPAPTFRSRRIMAALGNDPWSTAAKSLVGHADASLPESAMRSDLVALLSGSTKALQTAVAGTEAEPLVNDGRLLTGIRATIFSRLSS